MSTPTATTTSPASKCTTPASWERLWHMRGSNFVIFALVARVTGVAAAVLGGTTWMGGGRWAPDGAHSRSAWPVIGPVRVPVFAR